MQRASPLLLLLARQKQDDLCDDAFKSFYDTIQACFGEQSAEALRPLVRDFSCCGHRFFVIIALLKTRFQAFAGWKVAMTALFPSKTSLYTSFGGEYVGVMEGRVLNNRFAQTRAELSRAGVAEACRSSVDLVEALASLECTASTLQPQLCTLPVNGRNAQSCSGQSQRPLVQELASALFRAASTCQGRCRQIAALSLHMLSQSLTYTLGVLWALFGAVKKLGSICRWHPVLSSFRLVPLLQIYEALWLAWGKFPTVIHLMWAIECVVPVPAQAKVQPNFMLFSALRLVRVLLESISSAFEKSSDRTAVNPPAGSTSQAGQFVDSLTCSLCLGACTTACFTPCRHVFCWECIVQWIAKHKATCPVCRRSCTLRQLRLSKY